MEEVPACPICRSPRRSAFATVEGERRLAAFLVCHRCGHVYQSPRRSDAELNAFYASGYRERQQGTEAPIEKDLLMQAARARHTVDLIGARLGSVRRHLDIGSSSGALMESMRERYDCRTFGVEPGSAYREYSRTRGLRVFASQEDLSSEERMPFDLVTAMHVLEHLPDPVGMLTALGAGRMEPGAYLLVEVPNVTEHAALEEAHLHAFTRSSLKDAVGRAGFRVVWTRCHGGFRSPILRLFITLLAVRDSRPAPGRPLPLASQRTRLARRVGAAKRKFWTRVYPDWTWQSPETYLLRRGTIRRDA